MSGRSVKEFHEYITKPTNSLVKHESYIRSPASSLLKFLVEAKSSIDLCARKFPKKNNGEYTKDSFDSLQHLIISVIPTIMGHFETYQRYFFAGLFDLSVYQESFEIDDFFSKLKKHNGSISIDEKRLSAYRNIGTSSVGNILADCLTGWHDPKRVNSYFNAYNFPDLFLEDDCKKLHVLWQIRHSIVHTAGTLTLPDAQKVKELEHHGGKLLAFENNFIFEIARKIHPIIKNSTHRVRDSFLNDLIDDIEKEERDRIDDFFEVKSPINVWLR